LAGWPERNGTLTTTWDKTIIDRTDDLENWAKFRQLFTRNLKVYAYANNYYAGHGPDTVKLFWNSGEEVVDCGPSFAANLRRTPDGKRNG
jgi:hypothetical protein